MVSSRPERTAADPTIGPVDPTAASAGATGGHRARTTVVVAVLTAFAVAFVVANRGDVPAAWRALHHAHLGWAAVGLAAMAVGLVNLGAFQAAAQRATGLATAPLDLTATAIAGNSLNAVTKSGGLAGLTVLVDRGRRHGDPPGTVTAAFALTGIVGDVAFTGLMAVAVTVTVADGRLDRPELVALGAFAVYAAVRITIVVAAVRSRRAVRWVWRAPGRLVARLRRRPVPTVGTGPADDLYDALQLVRHRPRRAGPVLAHGVGVEVFGVIELWAAMAAAGGPHRITLALVGYAVAVLFAILSFLPAGLGFVELSLGTVLVGAGATAPTAAAVVVLYRLFELWLPVAVGLWCLRVERRSSRRPTP